MRFKRGLASVAGVAAVLLVGAIAPTSALAHPCLSAADTTANTTLTLHTGGNWAGALPVSEEHECTTNVDQIAYDASGITSAAVGEPPGPVVANWAI